MGVAPLPMQIVRQSYGADQAIQTVALTFEFRTMN
jgi:hypothetical protein